MNHSRLSEFLNDPRGPEMVLPSLPAEDLTKLLDALYQNLDTPMPVFGAQIWYDLAVEESARRTAPPADERSA